MLVYITMIIIGFVLLVIGADLLIKGASNVAKRFKISETLIGLTIVALGTSAPELIITITSASQGATDLIIGNAVGSNLCNILLILGIMSIIRPVELEKEIIKLHLPISLFVAIIILGMELSTVLMSQRMILDRLDGMILITLFAIYFSYPVFSEIKNIINTNKEIKKSSDKENINVFLSIFYIIIGVVLLKYGGDFVVDNATNIAQEFHLPERVIGLTIIAIGTAMPEFVTSIVAVIKKDTSLAVGNLVGSCVLNLLLILGIGAIITPLNFSEEFNNNIIWLIISTIIIWLLNFVGKKDTITKSKGLILLAMFSIYFIELFI